MDEDLPLIRYLVMYLLYNWYRTYVLHAVFLFCSLVNVQ